MNYLFTPSSLFRAWTLTAKGDPDIADGVHARVWFDPRLGLPVTPFMAIPLIDTSERACTGLWFDKSGAPLTLPIKLEQHSFVDVHVPSTVTSGYLSSPCRLRIAADPGAKMEALLLDRSTPGRVLARWIAESPIVTGPEVVRVRLRGKGNVTGLAGVDLSNLIAAVERAAQSAVTFGLPFDGDLPWYTGGEGGGAALTRVGEGAPNRLGPADRPDGSSVPADPDDEIERLKVFGTEVFDWAKAAVSHPSTPSALMRLAYDDKMQPSPPFPKVSAAGVNIAHALALTAIDPGIARFLGFATRLTDRIPPPERPLGWIVAGVFAVNPKPASPSVASLPTLLGAPNPAEVVMALAVRGLFPGISAMQAKLPAGWTLRFLFASLASGPPSERPRPPEARTDATGTWNVGRPSASWAQTITLGGPPLGPLALARDDAGTLTSLHDSRPTQGTFPERRALLSTSLNSAGVPTLADLKVLDDTMQGRWQLWQADVFGRWGDDASVEATQPPRPLPQPPSIETNLRYADGEIPGNESRSPGTVDIVVPIPPCQGLVPGARPIVSLSLPIAGAPQPISVTQPVVFDPSAQVRRSVPIPQTMIGGTASFSVEALFIDDVGAKSAVTAKVIVAHDPRRPPGIVRGPTLIWTSRRDSTGTAEISFAWFPLPGHAAYRVYLSDQNRLASLLNVQLPADATRADIAKFLSDHAANIIDKNAFSLLSETPLAAPASGPAHFRASVPGSLSGGLFARVVPLTEGNVEARFVDCGLVCLAVPHDQVPPAPTARVTPRTDGRFDIAIEAMGFRPALLGALQPKLFSAPPETPGAAPPEFRIRRTQGTTTEPLYAREVSRGKMTIEPGGDGTQWQAPSLDGPAEGFPPFVRFTWFVEVRYPAEIGRVGGAVDVPSGIVPDGGAVEGNLESPWSHASAPQTAMIVPPPPDEPQSVVVQRVAAGAQIDIPSPPVASPAAVAPYRIRIWRRDADQPFTLLSSTDASSVAPFKVVDPVAAVEYAIAYVDPIGRVGLTTVFPVP